MEKPIQQTTPLSKLEKTLADTFPRICADCSKLTNKQLLLTNPVLQTTTLNAYIQASGTSYGIAKLAIEEFNEGELLLIFPIKDAITIGSLLMNLEDSAIRENIKNGIPDSDCTDAFKEFTNQLCGMLENELSPKLSKPVHLKLTSTAFVNKENANTVFSEEVLNEKSLILTATMQILGIDEGLFIVSVTKLLGEELFGEAIEDTNKLYKGTVLVVDDSNTDQRIIKKFLSDEYKVLVTNNPNNALSMLQKDRIDLVLIDIYMPGVDGITLCERFRRNAMSHAIPIIICSSSPTQENVIDAVRAGATDFLVKPFTRQKLLEKIDRQLMNNKTLVPCA